MAKAAKFDRHQVIEKATNLYWKKGFHGTSMRNLQDEIDMRPGSIYAAFGSKEALFKHALDNYTDNGKTLLQQCLNRHDSAIEALKHFTRLIVIESRTQAPNGMCMLAKTIAELTEEQHELLNYAKQCYQSMEQAFASVLEIAQQQGEIEADKDVHQLARHLQIQISGLRTYAKGSSGDLPLEQMIDEVFTHYPF
ncbi:TetR/AcrR family transcriptional regulator [Vibrio sp. JPW-9-11-11]|uniref:TetR/AcrR family transcriptional regulator n=1 Tax=Vibrio sp. JPW-9-11-11 TaxID=1416532 RepID=UPI00159429C0|nr:TetR/AcrR family transcriptional regulator [Vibrio sp. JPW-9-11-11]